MGALLDSKLSSGALQTQRELALIAIWPNVLKAAERTRSILTLNSLSKTQTRIRRLSYTFRLRARSNSRLPRPISRKSRWCDSGIKERLKRMRYVYNPQHLIPVEYPASNRPSEQGTSENMRDPHEHPPSNETHAHAGFQYTVPRGTFQSSDINSKG